MAVQHCISPGTALRSANWRVIGPCGGAYARRGMIHAVEIDTIGRVLTTRERNYYDDSDFYAVVWDGERIRAVDYATTRYACCWGDSAKADATDETVAAANSWAQAQIYEWLKEAAAEEAELPDPGKRVKIDRKGMRKRRGEGTVFWAGECRAYAFQRYTERRVGVEFDDGERVFYQSGQVDVLEPGEYMVPLADLRAIAQRREWRDYWAHVPRAEAYI